MKKIVFWITAIFAVISFTGCSGSISNMQVAQVNKIEKPKEGESKIVFIRPSSMAYAIQSSVFKIEDNEPKMVGILAAKKKLSYDLKPGKHLFMVVGESADFMSAEVKEGKTYYALVTPRMGLWKARFSLKPVDSKESKNLNEYIANTQLVEVNEDTKQWALNNKDSIKSKYVDYHVKWMEKDESKRPKLLVDDYQ